MTVTFRKWALAGFCALVLLFAATSREASAAPIISFQGSTLGCFGSGCTSYTGSTTFNFLTFSAPLTDFTASVDANTSTTASVTLGTYSLPSSGNVNFNSGGGTSFTLQVNFTLPNLSTGTFGALITGNVAGTSANSILINFNNVTPLSFTFSDANGYGSFDLLLPSDPTLTNAVRTSTLTGRIQNVQYTAYPTGGSAPVVPEPTSLVLLGTGLAAVAARARRRTRPRG